MFGHLHSVSLALLFGNIAVASAQAPESADNYYEGTQRSPNGRYEAFTRVRRDRSYEGERNSGEVDYVALYVRNRRTARAWMVYRNSDWVSHAPVAAGWWPNNKRLLFWTVGYGSSSVNADGSELFDIPLTGGQPRKLGCAMRRSNCLAFSPDGRSLLLVDGCIRFAVEHKRVSKIDYRTGRTSFITGSHEAAIHPAWSPNGRFIAYVSTPDGAGLSETDNIAHRFSKTRLWVMRSDGTYKRQLTHDNRFHDMLPRWRGNSRLRFTRQENAHSERLSRWEIRADGKALRRISRYRRPNGKGEWGSWY